ncbi:MAG: Flp family type IVb pilin [Roseiarcus sp.]
MRSSLRIFLIDDAGATAIEYALIATLIALAVIPSMNSMSSKLKAVFNEVSSNLK